MRVLVTGASGYVGHQIASRLAAAGWDVVGSSRRPLALDGVRTVTGDHLDEAFVASILRDRDAVLHFAARTRGHDAADFQRDNQDMTALFCREARRLRKRFVFISSDQAVYGTGLYGLSKRACEDIVEREGGDSVTLRLTAVLGRYAPDMASTFSRIIERLHSSTFIFVPGDCAFPIAPVWIGDIERVIRELLVGPALPHDVFEVCGPVTTLRTVIDLFEQRLGVRRRRLGVPLGPVKALARLLKPYEMFAKLPLDALIHLGAPVGVSHEKLTRMTGFVPTGMARAVPLMEGFPGGAPPRSPEPST